MATLLERRDSYLRNVRMDAPLGQIEQALNYISPDVIDTEFQQYKFADPDLLIPYDVSTAMIGVDTITRYRRTMVGAWKLATDAQTNTPAADYYLQPVRYGNHYFTQKIVYTSQELDRQAFAQTNYPALVFDTTVEKRRALEEGYLQLINRCFSLGIPEIGIYGLLNHPDATRLTAPYGLGTGTTPDNNKALLTLGVSTIETATNDSYLPDTLLLPADKARQLNDQLYGTSGETTVLQAFLKQNPGIQVEVAPELRTAGPGGTPIAVFYERNTDVLEGVLPKPMTQIGSVQQIGARFEVTFDASLSGVHIKHPRRVLIMEGI